MLNLSYNQFHPGRIPAELGNLKNLKVLWFTDWRDSRLAGSSQEPQRFGPRHRRLRGDGGMGEGGRQWDFWDGRMGWAQVATSRFLGGMMGDRGRWDGGAMGREVVAGDGGRRVGMGGFGEDDMGFAFAFCFF
ncbi:hypothetical protein DVH24_021036 [Malus domestica]|uniref:Uncharacterized protein n=1 Tax=Malus domestica TaxID=3750 RepID=A0A498JDW5_MALDO|nr:hypothetical protein DVH24_021036 [Malus domestica]